MLSHTYIESKSKLRYSITSSKNNSHECRSWPGPAHSHTDTHGVLIIHTKIRLYWGCGRDVHAQISHLAENPGRETRSEPYLHRQTVLQSVDKCLSKLSKLRLSVPIEVVITQLCLVSFLIVVVNLSIVDSITFVTPKSTTIENEATGSKYVVTSFAWPLFHLRLMILISGGHPSLLCYRPFLCPLSWNNRDCSYSCTDVLI